MPRIDISFCPQLDSDAKYCANFFCHAPFSIFRRKHHCRKCGGVFCDDCASLRTELLDTTNLKFIHPPKGMSVHNYDAPVHLSRVCKDCHRHIYGRLSMTPMKPLTRSLAPIQRTRLENTPVFGPDLSLTPLSSAVDSSCSWLASASGTGAVIQASVEPSVIIPSISSVDPPKTPGIPSSSIIPEGRTSDNWIQSGPDTAPVRASLCCMPPSIVVWDPSLTVIAVFHPDEQQRFTTCLPVMISPVSKMSDRMAVPEGPLGYPLNMCSILCKRRTIVECWERWKPNALTRNLPSRREIDQRLAREEQKNRESTFLVHDGDIKYRSAHTYARLLSSGSMSV